MKYISVHTELIDEEKLLLNKRIPADKHRSNRKKFYFVIFTSILQRLSVNDKTILSLQYTPLEIESITLSKLTWNTLLKEYFIDRAVSLTSIYSSVWATGNKEQQTVSVGDHQPQGGCGKLTWFPQ